MNVNDLNGEQILEQMDRLQKPVRFAVLSAIAAVLIGVYWFALYQGKSEELAFVQDELTGVENEIAEARAVAANFETFQKQRTELRDELTQALQRLPNQKELPVLLTDISNLGKKSGLEVRSFRPRGENSRGFYAEVPIDLELFGSYHDLAIFLDRLSRLSRIVNMTRLSMNLDSIKEDTPKLRVSGVATTFRFIEDATSGE